VSQNCEETKIDFRKVDRYVPEELEKHYEIDNLGFQMDSKLFNDHFFDFIKGV